MNHLEGNRIVSEEIRISAKVENMFEDNSFKHIPYSVKERDGAIIRGK